MIENLATTTKQDEVLAVLMEIRSMLGNDPYGNKRITFFTPQEVARIRIAIHPRLWVWKGVFYICNSVFSGVTGAYAALHLL